MKKTLCMLLAIIMLIGLCACGNSSAPVDDSSAAAQEEADLDYRILVADSEGNPIPALYGSQS